MSFRLARLTAWAMWVTGVSMLALTAILTRLNPPISTVQPAESAVEGVLWLSTWLGFGLVGALVVSSRPDNRIGWLMCAITLGVGIEQLVPAYARFALVTEPGRWPFGEAAAWIGTWAFLPVVVLVVALVALYPSGVSSRFGRWVLRVFVFAVTLDVGVYALRPGPVQGDTPPENPLGIAGTRQVLDTASEWLGTLLVAIALVAVVEAFLRFRQSVGVERLQFRWFLLAIAMFPIMWYASNLLEELVVGVEGFDPAVVAFTLWGNGTAAAIGVAITRHGLYDIDRVISRTVAYVLVVGLLGAIFFGVVTMLSSFLPSESPLAVAGSTLAVAALFNPVRKRVQEWVDRRFNRSRYDAQRVMDRFAGSLQGRVDSEEVVDGWVSVVSETMQPASVAVWVRQER